MQSARDIPPVSASTALTLRDICCLFASGLQIATYQRRYLWGENDDPGDPGARLTDCLIDACLRGMPYFLQGITTCGSELIDGQQRVTYLALALRLAEAAPSLTLHYARRPQAQAWWRGEQTPLTPDTVRFQGTLDIIDRKLSASGISAEDFATFLLDNVHLLHINIDSDSDSGTGASAPIGTVAMYKMINGTKSPMPARDIIKADLLRMVSADSYDSIRSVSASLALRARYSTQWDDWSRWWHRPDVDAYYARVTPAHALAHTDDGPDLLLKLCLRQPDDDYAVPLSYEEFSAYIRRESANSYDAPKRFFYILRRTQKHFEEAFDNPETYNRVKAILLLLPGADRYRLLRLYFVDRTIDSEMLERIYKLAFLGMSLDEILRGTSPAARFDDLYASLSMADVYHSEMKRDVFNLLLRLNIDEDIKLGRRFDFSVWDNRSLEHIYSKSRVWHIGANGRPCDGNNTPLPHSVKELRRNNSYLCRDDIVNYDGTLLSEHCIGNLVLLYGSNNAEFGNSDFDKKKMMFLTPGDSTVFRSRNLLHSVCVFAGNSWSARAIVDNYNLTLRNLKTYYGQK